MATAADKRQWDKLHADFARAEAAAHEFERGLWARYGGNFQTSWLKAGEKKKLEQLRDRANKIGDKIIDMIVKVSPRADAWLSGVPSHWLRRDLTWEDMIRPRGESLSVVPPEAWGSSVGRREIDRLNESRTAKERTMGRRVMSRRQPSLPGFPDIPEDLEIEIPNMPMWEQIGGDMNPGAYGAILARSDGDAIEMLEIQPVREHGDDEAAEVGFPFWTREAYYDLSDLQKDAKEALSFIGMDQDDFEDLTPTQRALVIAEALLGYGTGVDEGEAGWSKDVVPGKVKWMSGEIAGPEYLEDEDEQFRQDVLGWGDIQNALEEKVQEMVDESAAQGWSQVDDELAIDLEEEGYDPETIVAVAEFGDAVAVNTDIETEKTFAGIEDELESEGYEQTDKGGRIPSAEGYAYADHVIDAVAKDLNKDVATVKEAAEALDWWQEEIPGSASGYGSIWAKKSVSEARS